MQTLIDLTDRAPMRFDPARMLADLTALEQAPWLEHYDPGLSRGWLAMPLVSLGGRMDDKDAQRALPLAEYHRYQRTPLVDHLPYIREILDAFRCPFGRTRIFKLMPGAGIGKHRDIGDEVACFAFNQVRLHIPIVTNPNVTFFVGTERIQMAPGRLYYVNFTKTHWVRNDGDQPRIHLVMDLGVNDWLRALFPPAPWAERVEHAVARATWPTLWALRQKKVEASIAFWRAYNGSTLQRISHRLRGRAA